MCTKHVHYDLIVKWAENPNQQVWIWSEFEKQWVPVSAAARLWSEDREYAVGVKPSHRPRRMCELGGVKFPEPERAAPKNGQRYYLPQLSGALVITNAWTNGDFDKHALSLGILHLTNEAACAHAVALMTANKQVVEK